MGFFNKKTSEKQVNRELKSPPPAYQEEMMVVDDDDPNPEIEEEEMSDNKVIKDKMKIELKETDDEIEKNNEEELDEEEALQRKLEEIQRKKAEKLEQERLAQIELEQSQQPNYGFQQQTVVYMSDGEVIREILRKQDMIINEFNALRSILFDNKDVR